MQTLNSSLTLKGKKMEEKGLTFFNNLIEENLQKVMAKYGAKETEKAFQIGYLKGALAMRCGKINLAIQCLSVMDSVRVRLKITLSQKRRKVKYAICR